MIRSLLGSRSYVYLTPGQTRSLKSAITDAKFKGLRVETEYRGLGFVTTVGDGDYELIGSENCLRDLKEEERMIAVEGSYR